MSAHDLTPRSAPIGPDGRCDAGHLDCPCTDAPTPVPAAGPRMRFVAPFRLFAESGPVRVITSELPGGDFLGRRFCTGVFGGPLEHVGDRYHTEAEATAGHAAICERVLGAVAS
jgi:hypothetical protein